jgi:hypothetical protein
MWKIGGPHRERCRRVERQPCVVMAFTCRQRPPQVQAGQAVPEGREGASHRDRHQQAVGSQHPGSHRAPAESVDEPATSTPICSLLNVLARLCHRLCTLWAHPSALRTEGQTNRMANEPEPALRDPHAMALGQFSVPHDPRHHRLREQEPSRAGGGLRVRATARAR